MPAHLPDGGSDVAHLRGGPIPARHMSPDALLRRTAVRIAWCAAPVVRMQYLAREDAVVVDLIPASPVTDRVVDDDLCIEFDGDDTEALPTSICLSHASARRRSSASRCAQHVLGKTIWAHAEALVRSGDDECEIVLDTAVRDSRLGACSGHRQSGVVGHLRPELLFKEKDSAAGDAFLEHLYSYEKYVAFTPYKQCEVERRPILGDEGAQGAAMAAMERFGIAQPDGPRGFDLT